MKKILLLSAFSFQLFSICLGGTLVEFPLQSFFNGSAYSKSITVTAVHPWLTDGTNLYTGSFMTITRTGATNPVRSLQPNDYILTAPESRVPLRFSVPITNTVQNVINLITNGLVTYAGWSPGGGGTFDYNLLTNKPNALTNNQTGLVNLYGNLTVSDRIYGYRGIQIASTNGNIPFVASIDQQRSPYVYVIMQGGTIPWWWNTNGDISVNHIFGDGSGLILTNAAGSKFSLVVNPSTNGFTFVPAP
ncbi:MAG TPA: hypothetical protein VNN22_24160 [Verrucomicrobiae bacterium]|nr:hypothetical protein [Verrucomicrobiae bacterium]